MARGLALQSFLDFCLGIREFRRFCHLDLHVLLPQALTLTDLGCYGSLQVGEHFAMQAGQVWQVLFSIFSLI